SPFEKLTEAHRALRSLEHIFLLDSHHREAPPGLGQLVALVVELLFPRKELLARHQPFLSRHDFWKTHLSFPRSFCHALFPFHGASGSQAVAVARTRRSRRRRRDDHREA